jgi:membrane associated rhomboid family serine protease
MPLTEMVAMVAVTAALALGFIALLRLIATMITHRTIRKAVETNPQLAEGLVQKLTERRESSGDDKLAIILITIGIAMAVAPLIAIDDRGMIRLALAASLFPLLVGGALWLRFRAAERAKRRERAE